MSKELGIPQVLRRVGDRWLLLPDVSSPAFVEEAHRQSLAISQSPHEADDQAFIDAVSKWNDEEDRASSK